MAVEGKGRVVEGIVERGNNEPGLGMGELGEQEKQNANPKSAERIRQEAQANGPRGINIADRDKDTDGKQEHQATVQPHGCPAGVEIEGHNIPVGGKAGKKEILCLGLGLTKAIRAGKKQRRYEDQRAGSRQQLKLVEKKRPG